MKFCVILFNLKKVFAEGYETLSETITISTDDIKVLHNFTLQEETGGSHEEFIYHTHEQLEEFLNRTTQMFPDQTKLYCIGKSVQGMM